MDAQQVIMDSIKGKRSKRQRLPSPLRLAFTSSSSSAGDGCVERVDNNMSSSTSPSTSIEFAESTGGEEEDMANCLILLAQGSVHHQSPKLSEPPAAAAVALSTTASPANKVSSGSSYVYQCKTCNRSFPSFQALGGHRASHKKPSNKAHNEVIEEVEDRQLLNAISTNLSLQMPMNIKTNKVHECSICGAEFSSGQALGGHMRRHRAAFATSSTTTRSLVTSSPESQESKKPRNSLLLDLNLPAPEDDLRESNLRFTSKEQVLVFSPSSWVDCHY